ncbi:class I adenylate-forming enzyme family protein [Paraburkholderia sp.]|uniref:class I adenylate-forming enzyme family protein n=1 Tax=Paraburkholderia sp. TaxID=1926495 RepID=UPI0023A22B25|nr:class I adenylate-forming enzyme family protein [Paraburkholderia sp.]MDE1180639.1 class I adenylate-forming enzyme family protein [Paraburkholderia sp.]
MRLTDFNPNRGIDLDAAFAHLITETAALRSPAAPADAAASRTTHAQRVATWRAMRLPPGSVVLMCMPNGRTLLQQFFALIDAGYVPAMLSPTTPAQRIRHMAEDFHAAALVKPRIGDALRRELCIGRVESGDDATWETGRFDADGQWDTTPLTEPGDVILTTSGTSSDFSSGCVHAFASLRENARKHAADIGLSASDTVLVNLPLYYSFALVAQALASLQCGARLVISGPPFLGARYLADLDAHRVTVSSVTPVLMRDLLAHGNTHRHPHADLHANPQPHVALPDCVRALTVGGDFLQAEHAAAFVERYPDKQLYLTYGITEAGPRVATGLAHDGARDSRRFASVGKPMQGVEVRLLDAGQAHASTHVHAATRDYGHAWHASREGELLVHSDTLLKRKIGRSAQDPLIHLDGKAWLKTGDIFEIDLDGYLYFKHRRSDFIVLNDEKVNLAAIKQFCRSLPGVLTCKTKSLRRAETVNGYFLEVTVDDLLVGPHEADAIRARILKGLKHYERPTTLTLTAVSRQQHEFYK